MKVKVSRSFGFVGTREEFVREFPDDYSEEEIEQILWEEMCEKLSLGFEILEEKDNG
jgi:hypothetical protein